MEEINKCELVDCWFYIDHTPPKGQGDWGGAIHKGACKLNSTDCKDTPTERCLVKSLYTQLKRKEKECEELKNCDKTLIYKQARNNFEKLNKYKQALQEIKEYCTSKYFYHLNGNTVVHTADILEIIDEVEK